MDSVLTTAEVQQLIEQQGADLQQLPCSPVDPVLSGTGGEDGKLYGIHGGAGLLLFLLPSMPAVQDLPLKTPNPHFGWCHTALQNLMMLADHCLLTACKSSHSRVSLHMPMWLAKYDTHQQHLDSQVATSHHQ